jgi:L-lactate dehydrogenase complex protein LldG
MTSENTINNKNIMLFKERALSVNISYIEVKNIEEAIDFTLKITKEKEKAKDLLKTKANIDSISDEKISPNIKLSKDPLKTKDSKDTIDAFNEENTLDHKDYNKTLFIMGVDSSVFNKYVSLGKDLGIYVGQNNLRRFYGGIDTSFSEASYGIAQTATVIMECPSEDIRLATELCEIHVIALKKSKILEKLQDAAVIIEELIKKKENYVSFITGPSRTSDIERVLTIGVHGSLELYIALTEE